MYLKSSTYNYLLRSSETRSGRRTHSSPGTPPPSFKASEMASCGPAPHGPFPVSFVPGRPDTKHVASQEPRIGYLLEEVEEVVAWLAVLAVVSGNWGGANKKN